MRLPPMTTRRWMIAVAIVGPLMGGVVGGIRLKRRHDGFRDKFRFHIQAQRGCRRDEERNLATIHDHENLIGRLERQPRDGSTYLDHMRIAVALLRELDKSLRRRADYHAAMARKYRYSARYPWLPVEPDPPEPE